MPIGGSSLALVMEPSGPEMRKGPWKRYLEAKTPGLCQIFIGGKDYCSGPVVECGKPGKLWNTQEGREGKYTGVIHYLCSEHEDIFRCRMSYRMIPVSESESGESAWLGAA